MMNFLCKLYIPSVNGGMFEATISGGDSRPDIKQKKWYDFGTTGKDDHRPPFFLDFFFRTLFESRLSLLQEEGHPK